MSSNPINDGEEATTTLPPEFALSGKIMLTAIVVLFFVVVLMICLHLYARWYHLRLRRLNRRNRRTQIVFHHDHAAVSSAGDGGGLDEAVMKSLPVFVYDSRAEAAPLECAVCLSEFEEGETGRVLPKCKHSFHIECIDMWFHSHSTCPLCRCAVESGPVPESCNPNDDVAINVCGGPEVSETPGTSSGLCSECCSGSSSTRGLRQTASFGRRRKPTDITVPSRHESFGRSEAEPSPSFRSPMSRMLSFKRILSKERRNGGVSPSGNANCSSVAELDIERGREGAE